ncbi:MAG: pyruvate kinase [Cytophagales bacterium]|nr:pyruvate kinase [Cytophagales bacterium]
MPLRKKTKIVATIGPASNSKKMLLKLVQAGANVFRLNFSHGTHEDHAKVIAAINELNIEENLNICKLQDLQGPKIRIGEVKDNGVEIKPNDILTISSTKEDIGDATKVGTTYKGIVNDVNIGEQILIDDGNLQLEVTDTRKDEIDAKVIYGGILKSRKGINLPNTKVSAPSLTEKDLKDLEFGLANDLDWVALSFVRHADDILDIKKRINEAGKTTKVIAKIEKPEALENIEAIIEVTDALMVARGDLGVEIPMEDVPMAQKKLVQACNRVGKPVIIATQMMESMIENPRPTRAETNDVANAVMDGADALMLSAESAAGKYPLESVASMTRTINAVELSSRSIYNKYYEHDQDSSTHVNDLLVKAACRLSETVEAKAIVGMTKSGYTGYRLALHRSKSNIYIFTNQKHLVNQMGLVWGVKCFYYDKTEGIDDTLKEVENILINRGILKTGDVFINTASMPLHWKGHTNMMKVSVVGQ